MKQEQSNPTLNGASEAAEAIEEARELVLTQGYDPEEVLLDEFGLELDYVFDLLEDAP